MPLRAPFSVRKKFTPGRAEIPILGASNAHRQWIPPASRGRTPQLHPASLRLKRRRAHAAAGQCVTSSATVNRGDPPAAVSGAHPWPWSTWAGQDGHDAVSMVSAAGREEMGSDVNVAAHQLLGVLEQSIDAAVMISSDSDLRLPVQTARDRVSIGTVSPSRSPTAGRLRGSPAGGAGRPLVVPDHRGRLPCLPASRLRRGVCPSRAAVTLPTGEGNCARARRAV